MTNTKRGTGGRRFATMATGLIGVGAIYAWASTAVRKAGISRRALFVREVLLPVVVPRTGHSPEGFRKRIAADRAAGPGMPSRKLRLRYDFTDETAGDRTLTLSPRTGPASELRILYLHGGAYVLNMSALHWTPIAGLVERTGGRVVAPLYPLAPEHTWETGMSCAERSYERLVAEVGAHNVVIAGDSAGGGLALALAQRLRDAARPLPVALVLFSPWLDITVSGADQPELAALDPILDITELRAAGVMWAGKTRPTDPAVSPLFGKQENLPPTIVFCGTHDLLVSDARRFAVTAARPDYHEYPGLFHVWMAVPIPEAQQALDEAAAFIDEVLDARQATGLRNADVD